MTLFRFVLCAAVLAACGSDDSSSPPPAQEVPPPPASGGSTQPSDQPPTPHASDVTGYLDRIGPDGAVEGWALASSVGAGAIDVAFYVDGDDTKGKLAGKAHADKPRADVNSKL